MAFDLKNYLSAIETLPASIGAYELSHVYDPGDGAAQIAYLSNDHGYFTITIYDREAILIPEDIFHPTMVEELENCIDSIFQMQDEGLYKNVELIAIDDFCFNESEESIFQSAFLTFQKIYEEGLLSYPQYSMLLIRGDQGYFHKIRFTESMETVETSFENIEEFLRQWLEFVAEVGKNVN